jgi:hypothetical protein
LSNFIAPYASTINIVTKDVETNTNIDTITEEITISDDGMNWRLEAPSGTKRPIRKQTPSMGGAIAARK